MGGLQLQALPDPRVAHFGGESNPLPSKPLAKAKDPASGDSESAAKRPLQRGSCEGRAFAVQIFAQEGKKGSPDSSTVKRKVPHSRIRNSNSRLLSGLMPRRAALPSSTGSLCGRAA